MKTQLLKGVANGLKPLLLGTGMPAMGTAGVLINLMRDLVTVSGGSEKQVRVVWKGKAKVSGGALKITGKATRRQMWADLLQA